MSQHAFHGIYPVLYAFHRRDGKLDHAAMNRQVAHCLEAGAHGLMVLGLITEVGKHTTAERHEIVAVTAAAMRKAKPFMVTVGEPTAAEQLAFAREARRNGADVIILQPPKAVESEAALLRFFGGTADALDCPVAVQHNPFNLAVNLSVDGLVTLHRNHPNVTVLKGEGTAVDTRTLIERTDGRLAVFSGHGGIELMTNLRAGIAGLIPAPDQLAVQVRLYDLWRQGTPEARAAAEDLHREVLPLIVFMIRSIDQALCYGKRFYARQLGVEVHDRPPSLAPTPFGIAELELLLDRYRETMTRLERHASS